MKTGQVVFFNWESRYSKIIRFYNLVRFKTEGYTHVGIITRVNKKSVVIHEAIGSGFVKSNYEFSFLEEKIKQNIINIKEAKKQYNLTAVEKHAKKYEGIGYGWIDIIFIALNFITGFKLGGDTNKLICSEAVAKILYDSSKGEINLQEEYEIKYDLIAPMHIFNSVYLK